MNVWLAALIVLGAAALVGLGFYFLDRTAAKPFVAEGARGAPTVIVTGTLFAVVLAFVTLASFQTYQGARTGSATEADALLDMARTANLFPPAQQDQLRSDFVCYGRAVVDQEWPAMRNGHPSPVVDQWITAYRGVFATLEVQSLREQAGFQDLLTQAASRTVGRQQRLSVATPTVPTLLWLALVLGGCVAVAVQLCLAGSHVRVHALMVAGLTALIVAGLLVVFFLDHPYQSGASGIQPSAMRRTLVMIGNLEPSLRPACSQNGLPA
jgi:hypothetical protein